LVMVLGCAAIFDDVALPGNGRLEIRVRVFPPPDLFALPIAAEDQVGIAIAIDVIKCAAGFDGEKIFFNDVAVPAGGVPAIPNKGRGFFAEAEHKVIGAVLVEVGYESAGLLGRWAGDGESAIGAAKMLPSRV